MFNTHKCQDFVSCGLESFILTLFSPFFFSSIMLQTRIVPWVDYQEFETVYQWLFADRKLQLDTIQLGVDRVNMTIYIY